MLYDVPEAGLYVKDIQVWVDFDAVLLMNVSKSWLKLHEKKEVLGIMAWIVPDWFVSAAVLGVTDAVQEISLDNNKVRAYIGIDIYTIDSRWCKENLGFKEHKAERDAWDYLWWLHFQWRLLCHCTAVMQDS